MSLNFFPPQMPDAWIRSSGVTNAAGQQPSGSVLNQVCPQFVRVVNGGAGDQHATFVAFSAWWIQRRLA